MAIFNGTENGDTINSTDLADTVYGRGGNDWITGLQGDDALYGQSGDDWLQGDEGADGLYGGGGNDSLQGGSGVDVLYGESGDDYLAGGDPQPAGDHLIGGSGNDIYYFTGGELADERLFAGPGVGFGDAGGWDEVRAGVSVDLNNSALFKGNIENVNLLGTEPANATGNGLDNGLYGNDAENVLIGNGGDDWLYGATGSDDWLDTPDADILRGGTGNDTYVVDTLDVIDEAGGSGIDTVRAAISFSLSGTPNLFGSVENLALLGFGNLNGTGNGLANAIVGNAATNVLSGLGGNDVLNSAGGGDTLIGGTGNDFYHVNGDDIVVEASGQGTDTVNAHQSYVLAAGVSVEVLRSNDPAGVFARNLTGNALKQTIIGGNGENILHDGGVGAADTLKGLAGNDTYRIFNAGDVIVEAASHGTADRVIAAVDYKLGAGVRIELMSTNGSAGTVGIDLSGNEFAQDITGNSGANRLEGKGGNDMLRGLGGDDTFVFASALGSGNVDTVSDFRAVDDRFLLSGAIFTALTPGTLAASAFRANTIGLAQDASDRIIYETDTGELYYDANGTAAGGGILFTKLTGLPAISSADFSVA